MEQTNTDNDETLQKDNDETLQNDNDETLQNDNDETVQNASDMDETLRDDQNDASTKEPNSSMKAVEKTGPQQQRSGSTDINIEEVHCKNKIEGHSC